MGKSITPRGIRNNNPLNIRKGNQWIGEREKQDDPAFEQFISVEYGIRAAFVILRNYIRGSRSGSVKYNTIGQIIRRWAPESENLTENYIATVCKLTGLHRCEVIRFDERTKMIAIVDAMIRVECGRTIDTQVIESAYDLV